MTTPASTGRKAAIWARVSTEDQHTENQLPVLRQWAADRGLEVVEEFVTEDSAWSTNGGKGQEYERQRELLIKGAHLGHYQVILIWAIDRLWRRGYKDLSATMDRLAACDCDVLSHQEEWLTNLGPYGEIVRHMIALNAEQESSRRSERIKLGMARAKAEGKRIGGRKPGIKETRPRRKRAPQPRKPAPEWMPQAQAMYDEVGADGKPAHKAHDIAAHFGTNVKSMYRHLDRNGPGGKARAAAPPVRLTEEETAKVQAMYDETAADGSPAHTVAEVCAAFGLTPTQLRRRISAHRPPVAGPGKRGILPPLTAQQLAVLAALEKRSPQATLQLGVHPDVVAGLEGRGLIRRADRDGGAVWRISDQGLDELARRQAAS